MQLKHIGFEIRDSKLKTKAGFAKFLIHKVTAWPILKGYGVT